MQHYFCTVGLMREDLIDFIGKDEAMTISDEEMESIAQDINDNEHLMSVWFDVLQHVLEQRGFKIDEF